MLKNLKIFSQNVQKSNFLINTVLEVNQDFDIIFIQEPLWTTLRFILSTMNPEDVPLLGVPNYPNWLTFARGLFSSNDFPRVITYINIRLFPLCFSFRKDIINHRDILLTSFFNNNTIFWIMNVYSDSSHTTLKYLKDTEVNLLNLIIIAGNFNIRDSIWDLVFPHYSTFSDNLMIIADSFNLELLSPTHNVPTRYSDSDNSSNSTIDLMFLWSGSRELNNHSIHPDLWLSSDYVLLTVSIDIIEENIILFKHSIAKNSEEKSSFIKDISHAIKNINISNLSDSNKLEEATISLASSIDHTWKANLKWVKIMKWSKSWWNKEYSCTLNEYRTTRNLEK